MSIVKQNVPDYYPYMYLDGHTPEEILAAAHKMILDRAAEKNAVPKVHITSEVKLK